MYFRWIKYLFPNLIRGNIGTFVGSVKSRCITRKNGKEDVRDNILKFDHINIPESVLEVPPPDGGVEISFNEFQKEGMRAIDVLSGFTNRLKDYSFLFNSAADDDDDQPIKDRYQNALNQLAEVEDIVGQIDEGDMDIAIGVMLSTADYLRKRRRRDTGEGRE